MKLTMDVSERVLSSLRQSPDEFGREVRMAAAAKWYELKEVTQGRAAEIAGVSRAEFLSNLSRYGVSPFQYEPDEIVKEIQDD